MGTGGERREEVEIKFQEGCVERVSERRGDGSWEQREQGSSERLVRGMEQCAGGRRREHRDLDLASPLHPRLPPSKDTRERFV